MARARKCDRCGTLYESYNAKSSTTNINGLITINRDDNDKYWSHGPYDLCPECSNEFTYWFNNVPEKVEVR